ncbi:MAG: AAA family ATPase [Methylococcaceae bacterium]|nr:AAA family ATPase [Methylococcaceae bacterium]
MYYAEFFHLKEAPFSIAPNPRYLFMSERHREALAHLLYGVVNGNGFVALTGEVGTGKTTLCNCLLDQLPDNVDLALVMNPRVNAEELLATLCDELEIEHPKETASLKVLLDALNAHLLKVHAQGRNTVLLIDEAQNLSIQVLEQIRLLTNLETNETKLLQIILVGQPELNQILAQQNLRQLNQRITARYHIEPLSLADCDAYIEHRLKVAGANDPVFTRGAVKKVFQLSAGIPRLVNIICDRAMLGAYSLGVHRVESKIVAKAAGEVLLPSPALAVRHSFANWFFVLVLISGFSGFYIYGVPERFSLKFSQPVPFEAAPAEAGKPMNDHRFESQSRIYGEMFGDIVPAARAGFTIGPIRTLNEETDSAGDTTVRGKEFSVPYASADKINGKSTFLPEQPGIRFIDQISNPGLTLYAALPQLFREWDIKIEPNSTNFCDVARRFGLRCLIQNGTWNYLLSLNTPAILEFALKKGVNRYATLIGVDGEVASFQFLGEDPLSFPISDVLPFWQGQFALLWKPPAPDRALLLRGYSNPAVVWLRETLQSIRGTVSQNPGSVFFDKELEDQVIAFQSDHGLNPDGKVGSETLILLNTLSNSPDIPRLTARRD